MSNEQKKSASATKHKTVEYSKYGYLFVAPFFIVYLLFQFGPLCYTIVLSFMENRVDSSGFSKEIGPNFIGLRNYLDVFGKGLDSRVFKTIGNTIVMWLLNFVPQIILSLVFAKWFTDTRQRVKLKAQGAYKIIMFLPNIITASSISVLFFAMFSNSGFGTAMLRDMGVISKDFDFFASTAGTRGMVAFIQFWMWYGNTMIILIAGMLGINPSLYEAAMVDGANSGTIFFKITLPLLKPIILFTLVTSAIGGLQMYDIPMLLNDGKYNSETIIMYIKTLTLNSKNYGQAATASVILFVVTLIISIVFFAFLGDKEENKTKKKKEKKVNKANA